MFKYFKDVTLLIMLGLVGCFLTFIGFLLFCFILVFATLLAFYTESIFKINKVVLYE